LEQAATGTFRVGFLNHGGFATVAEKGKRKEEQLRKHITKYKFSSMCLTEHNVHWNSIPVDERLEERTADWFEKLATNTTYYKNCPVKSPQQYGGCDNWSIDKAAYRILSRGSDKSGLGRWCWTRYRGKNNKSLRVVAAYRPVENKTGPDSVWNQQKSYFLNKMVPRNPRTIFNSDLAIEAASWIEAGDQIIIGVDANEQLTGGSSSLEKTLAHPDIDLHNAITKRHGTLTPNT